ncbi:hypothetical protein OEW28_17390 [Defluviimonas sp. WL0002]|uniref:MotA/TolQ/ExbB proton channel family protein n=1 Tax=Albidovulum marisflavi TaxID=2984159 RepID=A0ABT2ZI36_9RHOB|nr:hypothetical protein [Defluviimonas sp. WL0002]MCV2870391.1 hypothetical protein [Defluviimonas sp. WL0002]
MENQLENVGLNQTIDDAGRTVVDLIITLAELLTKNDGAPGLVAILLVLALLVFGLTFWLRTRNQVKAVGEMRAMVEAYPGIREFSSGFDEFRAKVKERSAASKQWFDLSEAWDEFSETVVVDDVDGTITQRNSIRPSSFLNVHDLGFGPGVFRILPNLFVSVGLFLTFLGLVAALNEFSLTMQGASNADAGLQGAMTGFMQIASAKFVMSLVGLACSIVFTYLLRKRGDFVDHELHKLCLRIERRLVFVSLEDIGFRQLKAATEQREHLREIGFSMVAELRKPLDELPEHITRSISAQMDPIIDKVSRMGTASMEGLVGDLSTQLTHSVGNALNRASESLGEASDRISLMVDRMNASNAQAGDGLQSALAEMAVAINNLRQQVAATGETASSTMTRGAEQLLSVMNETLAGIRDNTSEGAAAMRSAADEMRQAAERFRDELAAAASDGAAAAQSQMAATTTIASRAIDGAGKVVLESFESASQEIARLGATMGETIGGTLLHQLDAVSSRLGDLGAAIDTSVAGANSAASGLRSGAEAVSGASASFGDASRQLVGAVEPLRNAHDKIESQIRKLAETTASVSDIVQADAKSVVAYSKHVLDTAQAALGTEREGIRASLEATRVALQEISDQAEKLDQIDIMLGKALSNYNSQLEAALGAAQDHVTQMRDRLAPGIDTLRSVVEQAEAFLPAQGRRA